jgi:DNA-binding transcriptional ArsR family regulator
VNEPRPLLTDPGVLKGLAQPLRQQLYRLLVHLGPATVTALAEHADGDPGQISYHLRELGKRGFIEEAPELARDRRERWWRVIPESLSWPWVQFKDAAAAETSNSYLGLTPDELRALNTELNEVLRRWADVGRLDPKSRPEDRPHDGRQNVFLFFHAFPEKP